MRPEEPADVGVGFGEASAGIEAHRFGHEAMATVFEVFCAHDDPGYAGQAARAAFDLVDRLEREPPGEDDRRQISLLDPGRKGSRDS